MAEKYAAIVDGVHPPITFKTDEELERFLYLANVSIYDTMDRLRTERSIVIHYDGAKTMVLENLERK